jgi:primosomal protein N'
MTGINLRCDRTGRPEISITGPKQTKFQSVARNEVERSRPPPFRLLVKSQRGFDLAGYPRTWLAAAPKAKCNIKLEVNVDPQSVL